MVDSALARPENLPAQVATGFARWASRRYIVGGPIASAAARGGELSTQADEKAKITATVINTLAVAIIVAGCVAPLFSVLYGLGNLTPEQVRLIEIAAPTWFLIGVVIHSLARAVLGAAGTEP